MIIVFPCVIVASFFGKIQGGNAIYRICTWWGDMWYFLIGIRHRNIFEASLEKGRPNIFVANHISYLDAPMIVKSLHLRVRVLGKSEMRKVPIFGFIYSRAVVMVDRSDAEKRAKSVRALKSILRKGISIFLFPEGTFNLTRKPLKDFYDGAFRIAIETQTPIRPMLFLDAYTRMDYKSIFSLNPGKSRTIFLEQVDVEGYTMQEVQKLKQKVYDLMERKLIEYGARWIGETSIVNREA